MKTIMMFLVALLIFAWGWHRVYAYNAKKGTGKFVCHMLGCLLGMFPAQFFFYACAVTWTPPDIEPAEPKMKLMMWGVFIICAVFLMYLTSRPIKSDKAEKSSVLRDETTPVHSEH